MSFGSVGLSAGTTTSKLDLNAAVDFSIDGVMYTSAIADETVITNSDTGVTFDTQAALTTCLYLVGIDSANAVTVTKGAEIVTADLGENAALHWPECPANDAPVGAFRVLAASGYTFIAGTTALDATGITTTYYDLSTVPTTALVA
jgi:hypothetical protein